jgi:hypothetical protein
MIAVLLLVLGCTGSVEGQCLDNGNCSDGQACIEKVCQDVECLAPLDCAFGSYCDVADDHYTCTEGCASDDDCEAGDECDVDSNECKPYGCRSTELDCALGQVCNERSGECTVPNGEWCTPCDDDPSACGDDATCFLFPEYDGDPNPPAYCLPTCDGEGDECPRGYECVDESGGLGQYSCATWCPYLP